MGETFLLWENSTVAKGERGKYILALIRDGRSSCRTSYCEQVAYGHGEIWLVLQDVLKVSPLYCQPTACWGTCPMRLFGISGNYNCVPCERNQMGVGSFSWQSAGIVLHFDRCDHVGLIFSDPHTLTEATAWAVAKPEEADKAPGLEHLLNQGASLLRRSRRSCQGPFIFQLEVGRIRQAEFCVFEICDRVYSGFR